MLVQMNAHRWYLEQVGLELLLVQQLEVRGPRLLLALALLLRAHTQRRIIRRVQFPMVAVSRAD